MSRTFTCSRCGTPQPIVFSSTKSHPESTPCNCDTPHRYGIYTRYRHVTTLYDVEPCGDGGSTAPPPADEVHSEQFTFIPRPVPIVHIDLMVNCPTCYEALGHQDYTGEVETDLPPGKQLDVTCVQCALEYGAGGDPGCSETDLYLTWPELHQYLRVTKGWAGPMGDRYLPDYRKHLPHLSYLSQPLPVVAGEEWAKLIVVEGLTEVGLERFREAFADVWASIPEADRQVILTGCYPGDHDVPISVMIASPCPGLPGAGVDVTAAGCSQDEGRMLGFNASRIQALDDTDLRTLISHELSHTYFDCLGLHDHEEDHALQNNRRWGRDEDRLECSLLALAT